MVEFVRRLFRPGQQADREQAQRLAAFRAELESTVTVDEARIEMLSARWRELALSEDDAALEFEMLDGLREVLALQRAAQDGGLAPVATNHRVLGADVCYFIAPASMPDDRNPDQVGKLFLTDRRAVLMGGGVTSIGWSSVLQIADRQRDIILQAAGRPEAYRFRCNSFVDSKRGVFIARWLKSRPKRGA